MNRSLLILALLAATPAFAQQAAPAKPASPKPADARPPALNAEMVFDAWDKNKDGTLSKAEFQAGWALTRDEMALQRLHSEFDRRDANNSGKIEANEFAGLAMVQRAGKNAPQLSAFDKNKDTALDFPEYIEFVRTSMKSLPPPAAAPAAKP